MEVRKSTANAVKSRIDSFEKGYIFSYMEFEDPRKNKEAIIKELNRLVKKGTIHKLSKGKFYKSDSSAKTIHVPKEDEIIKDLLEKNGQIIGYKTGWRIYNKNKIAPELSNTILIGRNYFKPPLKRGDLTIKFVLQKNEIKKENIKFLQILDCLKMRRKIPDSSEVILMSIIGKAVRKFNKQEREILIQYSLNYPPSTRSLLVTIFSEAKIMGCIDTLQETLNPVSTYNITLKKADKLARELWRIK